MFFGLSNTLPGVVFLAKENEKIVGVMRMKSCIGKAIDDTDLSGDENDIDWRKSVLFRDWAKHDPAQQHWHLGPIGVLPTHQGLGLLSLVGWGRGRCRNCRLPLKKVAHSVFA